MKTPLRLTVLVTLAALTALAASAPPAVARLTPAGGMIFGPSTDPEFGLDSTESWCPDADLNGRIAADGLSISATVTLTNLRYPCERWWTTIPAPVTCTNFRFTLRSTSSAAGISAAGTVILDSGAECTIRIDVYPFCEISFAGPQTLTGNWRFTQATQTLDIDARGIVLRTRGAGCPRTGEFTGTFRMRGIGVV